MKAIGAAALLVATTVACAAVPDLHFEPDASDASIDAGAGRADAGRKDAGPEDAAGEADTEHAMGCPATPPVGGSCCPGVAIPCFGKYCEAGCATCNGTCGTDEACCAKAPMHSFCRSLEAGCP